MFLSDDASRVLLAGGKDDYINASHIGVSLLQSVSLSVCLVVPSIHLIHKSAISRGCLVVVPILGSGM